MISDVTINALFRPNQTFPNGGLLRGDTALTGEVGIGRTLTNTASSRVCLSPNPVLEFQDLWISDGGVVKSSTFQNMAGNDFTRVISYDAVNSGTISIITDTTSTTLNNCVFHSIVMGNSAVAGSVTVNNSVIIDRMLVRANNLLTFLNSISLATDWYLGRPTDSGAESLVNYCYIKENANANEFGSGSSNNTLNTDSTSDLVNVALKDYRTGSASPQATGNGSGGLIGAFLEVSGGTNVSSAFNLSALQFTSVIDNTPIENNVSSAFNLSAFQFTAVIDNTPVENNVSSTFSLSPLSFSAVIDNSPPGNSVSSAFNLSALQFTAVIDNTPVENSASTNFNLGVLQFAVVVQNGDLLTITIPENSIVQQTFRVDIIQPTFSTHIEGK